MTAGLDRNARWMSYLVFYSFSKHSTNNIESKHSLNDFHSASSPPTLSPFKLHTQTHKKISSNSIQRVICQQLMDLSSTSLKIYFSKAKPHISLRKTTQHKPYALLQHFLGNKLFLTNLFWIKRTPLSFATLAAITALRVWAWRS